MALIFEFEKPVATLNAEIAQLQGKKDKEAALAKLVDKRDRLLADIYGKLTPWQKTQVARHPERPRFLYITDNLFQDFLPLAGDRSFSDDPAILGGPARFNGQPVMLIGHEKGDSTETRVKRNFGMAKPEGYRKAARLMDMASRFGMPIITLIDTPGAFPGIEAEERGQAEAIARATEACLQASVPMVAVVIGEGGSGGAVALAAANRVLMLEHAVYSVISPEGCASILWRDSAKAADAAQAMRITASDLKDLNVIDTIVPEPVGGAHRSPAAAIGVIGSAIRDALHELEGKSGDMLRIDRRARFLAFSEAA